MCSERPCIIAASVFDGGIEAGNMSTIKINLPDKNICFSFKSSVPTWGTYKKEPSLPPHNKIILLKWAMNFFFIVIQFRYLK